MSIDPFDWPADVPAVQRALSRAWPRYTHPGGLAWALVDDPLGADAATIRVNGELVGWAGFAAPSDVFVECHRRELAVVADALAWALERATIAAADTTLTLCVAVGDQDLASAGAAAGFVTTDLPSDWHGMFRSAGPAPPTPAGYRVRHVEPGEAAARVEAHREAWLPAALPWHPDHQPDSAPGATSAFTMRRYEQVRSAWLYRPDLDLVVEDDDGRLVACCIAWFDPSTGCAEIEPLGVLPDHRRRGLAGALCHEVCRRVGALGGDEVFINVGPRVEYPASAGAYARAGFEVRVRGQYLHRPPPGIPPTG